MNQKDLLELKYWLTGDVAKERAMQPRYLEAFGFSGPVESVLEIGTGPFFGMLPLIESPRKVGVDPLYQAYYDTSILDDQPAIERVGEPFESWHTDERFDGILSANALDHGEMGFDLVPKIAGLLKPGGRLYLHVHLRPAELLNLIHDHCLTVEDLDRNLEGLGLVELKRDFFEHDIDGEFCSSLVGVWQRPL